MVKVFLTITDLTVLESAQKHHAAERGGWGSAAIQSIGWPEAKCYQAGPLGISKSIQKLIRLGFVERVSRGWFTLTEKGRDFGEGINESRKELKG